MIDISRDDGATGSDFIADKFGGDFVGQISAEALTGVLHQYFLVFGIFSQFLQFHAFADGNVFHFRCDQAFFSEVHLGDVIVASGAAWRADMLKTQICQFGVVLALLAVLRAGAFQ